MAVMVLDRRYKQVGERCFYIRLAVENPFMHSFTTGLVGIGCPNSLSGLRLVLPLVLTVSSWYLTAESLLGDLVSFLWLVLQGNSQWLVPVELHGCVHLWRTTLALLCLTHVTSVCQFCFSLIECASLRSPAGKVLNTTFLPHSLVPKNKQVWY